MDEGIDRIFMEEKFYLKEITDFFVTSVKTVTKMYLQKAGLILDQVILTWPFSYGFLAIHRGSLVILIKETVTRSEAKRMQTEYPRDKNPLFRST